MGIIPQLDLVLDLCPTYSRLLYVAVRIYFIEMEISHLSLEQSIVTIAGDDTKRGIDARSQQSWSEPTLDLCDRLRNLLNLG